MEKNRIEAFSDGVIAIIITLLVLELKVPHTEGVVSSHSLLSVLYGLTPKFLSWSLSFFMVLIMWVNHHRIFNNIKKSDNGLLWINGLLLFCMSFVPFPTAFMGDYFSQPVAMSFFGLCMGSAALSFYFLRLYLIRHAELFRDDVDIDLQKKLLRKTVTGPLLYFIGAGTAFVNVNIAYIIYAIVPIYFIFFGIKKNQNKSKQII